MQWTTFKQCASCAMCSCMHIKPWMPQICMHITTQAHHNKQSFWTTSKHTSMAKIKLLPECKNQSWFGCARSMHNVRTRASLCTAQCTDSAFDTKNWNSELNWILSERGRTNEILVIIIFGISIGLQRSGQFITMLPWVITAKYDWLQLRHSDWCPR